MCHRPTLLQREKRRESSDTFAFFYTVEQQLIGNPFFAPKRVVLGHPPAQEAQLTSDRRPAGAALYPPQEFPAHAMPANHRDRLHHDQRPAPIQQPPRTARLTRGWQHQGGAAGHRVPGTWPADDAARDSRRGSTRSTGPAAPAIAGRPRAAEPRSWPASSWPQSCHGHRFRANTLRLRRRMRFLRTTRALASVLHH